MLLRGSFLAANPPELPLVRRAHGPTTADILLSLKVETVVVKADGNGSLSVRLTAPLGLLLRPLMERWADALMPIRGASECRGSERTKQLLLS